jgi:hypothetical protein
MGFALELPELRLKMKRTGRLLLPVIMGIALCATSASAALNDNGNSMIDDGTNLEWLDLDEATLIGQSVTTVLSSPFVTVDGYVYATDEQVAELFTNAGFVTGASTASALNDPAAADLLSFLGCTQDCGISPGTNPTGRGFAIWSGATYTRAFYKEGPSGASWATTSGLTADVNLTDSTAGHFLVRAVVPEPSTAILMLGGLALLSGRRRRDLDS